MTEANTPTREELDSYLFKCADIIRDTVDRNDYKDYILPLVFYKSISDTYEDNKQELIEEYGDEEIAADPSFHDIVVPEEYTWDELRKQNERIDQFIDDAFDEIEKANEPRLDGVFRTSFRDPDALGDTRLLKLVEHISTHNLSSHRIPEDTLGEVYMDLVRHFAEEEGRGGGEFFTPPKYVELLVRLLAPYEQGAEIHDPTCGSGGMLVQAARYAANDDESGKPDTFRLTGQEINPEVAPIAKMNLFINGYGDNAEISREDSLSSPQFTKNGRLEEFDYVLANFPFSADWDKEGLREDKYSRFNWSDKKPRKDRADYAFIMHIESQLSETGRAAVISPNGVLFRKDEKKFREYMLENDLLEAVVGMSNNLFQNNSIPSAVLVLNKDKDPERQGQVQFVHAADNHAVEEPFYRELSNQNVLTDEGIEHIATNFHDWRTEERVSRTVSLDEIRENDYNLNIALYVDTTEPEENIDVSEELAALRELQAERDEIESRMDEHMEVLGYE